MRRRAGALSRVIVPRAERALDEDVAMFGRLGCELVDRPAPLHARMTADDRTPFDVRLIQDGRFFGGTYSLEVTTAEPVLPACGGLTARACGVVRTQGVRFRGRDAAGRELAAALDRDGALQRELAGLHFERVFVRPDGTPGIRHLGGSLVWVLLPPVIRATPLVEEQAAALLRALRAFAAAAPLAEAAR